MGGANLHKSLATWRDAQGQWKNVSIQNSQGVVVSKATYGLDNAHLEQTITVRDSKIDLQSVFTPKREACKLAGGTMFSLQTEAGSFLNLDANDRPVFAHDFASE